PIRQVMVGAVRGSARGGHRAGLGSISVEVRVQAPAEEVRPVPVRAGVADVERVRSIPLDRERVDDVVRIEDATLLELDAVAQRAGPYIEGVVRRAFGCQCRNWLETGGL